MSLACKTEEFEEITEEEPAQEEAEELEELPAAEVAAAAQTPRLQPTPKSHKVLPPPPPPPRWPQPRPVPRIIPKEGVRAPSGFLAKSMPTNPGRRVSSIASIRGSVGGTKTGGKAGSGKAGSGSAGQSQQAQQTRKKLVPSPPSTPPPVALRHQQLDQPQKKTDPVAKESRKRSRKRRQPSVSDVEEQADDVAVAKADSQPTDSPTQDQNQDPSSEEDPVLWCDGCYEVASELERLKKRVAKLEKPKQPRGTGKGTGQGKAPDAGKKQRASK